MTRPLSEYLKATDSSSEKWLKCFSIVRDRSAFNFALSIVRQSTLKKTRRKADNDHPGLTSTSPTFGIIAPMQSSELLSPIPISKVKASSTLCPAIASNSSRSRVGGETRP